MTTRLLAIPALNGWVHADCVVGLADSGGLYDALMIHHGRASLSLVRDEITNNFMRSQFDELVMIDSDVGFDRAGFKAFVETEGELVAPQVYKREAGTEPQSTHRFTPNGFPLYFSCCAIKIRREALQAIANRAGKYSVKEQMFSNLFPCGVLDGEFLSEAYYFSALARRAGCELKMADVTFRHWGMIQF